MPVDERVMGTSAQSVTGNGGTGRGRTHGKESAVMPVPGVGALLIALAQGAMAASIAPSTKNFTRVVAARSVTVRRFAPVAELTSYATPKPKVQRAVEPARRFHARF